MNATEICSGISDGIRKEILLGFLKQFLLGILQKFLESSHLLVKSQTELYEISQQEFLWKSLEIPLIFLRKSFEKSPKK